MPAIVKACFAIKACDNIFLDISIALRVSVYRFEGLASVCGVRDCVIFLFFFIALYRSIRNLAEVFNKGMEGLYKVSDGLFI